MKKETKIAIIIFLILLFFITFILIVLNKRNYELNLPKQEKLKSITIETQANQKEIIDAQEIQDIIYILNNSGKGRSTKQESINDFPVNTENIITVKFNFEEEGTSTIFVYIRNNNYYIEQPYNGIYKISGDEYNSIEKYIR